jgi:hypothetical protein
LRSTERKRVLISQWSYKERKLLSFFILIIYYPDGCGYLPSFGTWQEGERAVFKDFRDGASD